ncbi:MAG: helix-hairpin-helix domain-containing protein, partial [Promethearchaeota archaeon]
NQGQVTKFRSPSEEDKTAGLIRIAQKNIALLIQQKEEYEQYLQNQGLTEKDDSPRSHGLRILQEVLHLEQPPLIIEAFDMSHLQGIDYVGSKVCLVEGRPSKRDYRRYKIKDPTITASDDIAAMKEVMTRRYKRALKENEIYPDLIVVDGGKAQLNMAYKLLNDLGIKDIPIIGLSKPPGRSEIYRPPNIIIPGQKTPLKLPKDSPALHLLQLLRDESHRFAIKYHRKLREKRQTKSELDGIPGVGPARKTKLLRFFGSVAEIKTATVEQLRDVVGSKLGQEIYTFFKTQAVLAEKKSETKTKSKKKLVLRRKSI